MSKIEKQPLGKKFKLSLICGDQSSHMYIKLILHKNPSKTIGGRA